MAEGVRKPSRQAAYVLGKQPIQRVSAGLWSFGRSD